MKTLLKSGLTEAERMPFLRRPAMVRSKDVQQTVARVFADIAEDGDEAVRAYARQWDGCDLSALEVPQSAIEQAGGRLDAELRTAILAAAERIRIFHAACIAPDTDVETAPGLRLRKITRAIPRVGLYVPAGSAALFSTALMLTIPADLAGCPEIILCSPPDADGQVHPSVLYVASLNPRIRVFAAGGIQAIAAMALGTASVPACDKIFGPGNAYVDEAKRYATQLPCPVAIDLPAGPSEVLVIADRSARADFVAADLLSQAEHGPDSQVVLLSDDGDLIAGVQEELARQLPRLARREIAERALTHAVLMKVDSVGQALALSNAYAPEHLILSVANPDAALADVQCAGSVFLGHYTPEALGDYCSGSNHVLPTNAAARAWSGLTVSSFRNAISVQSATPKGLRLTGPDAVCMAEAEGLGAHAHAVRIRLEAVTAVQTEKENP